LIIVIAAIVCAKKRRLRTQGMFTSGISDPMPNGCQLKIILYAFKLAKLASFENKIFFELSTQKRG